MHTLSPRKTTLSRHRSAIRIADFLLKLILVQVCVQETAVGSNRHDPGGSAAPAGIWMPPRVAPRDPRPLAWHGGEMDLATSGGEVADALDAAVPDAGAGALVAAVTRDTGGSHSRANVLGGCPVEEIAAGGYHNLARLGDGRILAWGKNSSGQVGNGGGSDVLTPVAVDTSTGLGDATALSGGLYHSLALADDGAVWAWGENGNGQLGDGTFASAARPLRATGLPPATAVAAGWYHSLALAEDGSVWAWGDNGLGQLGNGGFTPSPTPVAVAGLPGRVIAIAAGSFHSVALLEDGRIAAWGYGGFGQLGDGGAGVHPLPVLAAISGVTGIAAGANHTLAVTADGGAWAWGFNGFGQLGNGTSTNARSPVAIAGLSGIAGVAAGEQHSLAWTAAGAAFGFGYNRFGQLGQPSPLLLRTPVAIASLPAVADLAAGSGHSLARLPGGELLAFGAGPFGQLGDGTVPSSRPAPGPVATAGFDCAANRPPLAVAGGPYAGNCEQTPLDGASASDPEGAALAWHWLSSEPMVHVAPESGTLAAAAGSRSLPPAIAQLDPAVAPCGVTAELTLEVTDPGGLGAHATTQVQFLDQDAPELSGVPASTTASCDAVPAAAAVTAMDDCDAAPVVGFEEQRIDGDCANRYRLVRSWTATDRCGNVAAAVQSIEVSDTTRPTIAASSAVRQCLWPPNHQYVCFDRKTLPAVAGDSCSRSVSWRFVGCASDQPDDDGGDGHFLNDCRVSPGGDGFCVRAERTGNGKAGRHYTVTAVARDACGNESAATPIGIIYVPSSSESHAGCIGG